MTRILCEFEFRGKSYGATPIIIKTIAFKTEEGVNRFLDEKIDKNSKCTLWVDPDNPLHTVFHKKPESGPYNV